MPNPHTNPVMMLLLNSLTRVTREAHFPQLYVHRELCASRKFQELCSWLAQKRCVTRKQTMQLFRQQKHTAPRAQRKYKFSVYCTKKLLSTNGRFVFELSHPSRLHTIFRTEQFRISDSVSKQFFFQIEAANWSIVMVKKKVQFFANENLVQRVQTTYNSDKKRQKNKQSFRRQRQQSFEKIRRINCELAMARLAADSLVQCLIVDIQGKRFDLQHKKNSLNIDIHHWCQGALENETEPCLSH